MTIERPDRWSLEIRKCNTEVKGLRAQKTGGARVVGTVCALYKQAGIELSANLPPLLPPELPKLISHQHPKSITTKLLCTTKPPALWLELPLPRRRGIIICCYCCLRLNVPLRPLLLCSSAGLRGVAVHFGDLLFLLELFAQDCIWRCSAL